MFGMLSPKTFSSPFVLLEIENEIFHRVPNNGRKILHLNVRFANVSISIL